MSLRISKSLQREEKYWIGKRVRYFLMTLCRDGRLEGPYTGVVAGLSNNAAAIEDRLEGHTRRDSVEFTGDLIIVPDDGSREDDWTPVDLCEIIETESRL